jgi:hypothetical protein
MPAGLWIRRFSAMKIAKIAMKTAENAMKSCTFARL